MKSCVGKIFKVQAASVLLAIMLASTLSVTYAQSPARDEDIGLMLAYPLSLINEPVMWRNCGDSETSYRFTENVPDRVITSVRLSRVSERPSAYTAYVELPNEPKLSNRSVTETDWTKLEALIVKTDFWELPTEVSAWKLESFDSNYYLEGCRNGQYQAMRRDPTHLDDVAELISYLVSFLRSHNEGREQLAPCSR